MGVGVGVSLEKELLSFHPTHPRQDCRNPQHGFCDVPLNRKPESLHHVIGCRTLCIRLHS
jgi:hypothetical protein